MDKLTFWDFLLPGFIVWMAIGYFFPYSIPASSTYVILVLFFPIFTVFRTLFALVKYFSPPNAVTKLRQNQNSRIVNLNIEPRTFQTETKKSEVVFLNILCVLTLVLGIVLISLKDGIGAVIGSFFVIFSVTLYYFGAKLKVQFYRVDSSGITIGAKNNGKKILWGDILSHYSTSSKGLINHRFYLKKGVLTVNQRLQDLDQFVAIVDKALETPGSD